MANARKCDRCNRCFSPLEAKGIMARFRNPIFQTANDIREGVISSKLISDESTDALVDLCPNCTEMFREFMSGSVKIKAGNQLVNASDLVRALFMGGDYDGDK